MEGSAESDKTTVFELFLESTTAFILKYRNIGQNDEMKKLMCENFGRFIQSREFIFLEIRQIMDILNDERTFIPINDYQILSTYIREQYPKKMEKLLKSKSVQRLKQNLSKGNKIFDEDIQINKSEDLPYMHYLKIPQQGPLLNLAFQNNDSVFFKTLIDNGFDSTMSFDGFEPVDFEIVKCKDHKKANDFFQLLNDYSLESIDDDGNTLLMAAIWNKFSVDNVKTILKKLPRIDLQNKNNQNIFHLAASNENSDYLKCLINMPINHSYFFDQKDLNGNTPLHIAAKESLDNIDYFLTEGVDFTIKNNEGDTPLHIIIKNNDEQMAAEKIHEINSEIKKYSEDSFIVGDSDGNTPLHLAIKKKYINCIRDLLSIHSEAIHIKNNDNLTPMEMCAMMDDPEIFLTLNGDDKQISFILLTKMRSRRIIKCIKDKITFDEQDEEGNTAFHLSLMDLSCKDISIIYFEHIRANQSFDVLQKANNLGQVPIVLVNKHVHSVIYNNIFRCHGQSEKQMFECYLKNNDEYGIKTLLNKNKNDRKQFLEILVKYGNIDQWNKYSVENDQKYTRTLLRASTQSGNSNMAQHFIKEMGEPWSVIYEIVSLNPINIELLKYSLKYYDIKHIKINFMEECVRQQNPEAAKILLPDNFDPSSLAAMMTNMNSEMMKIIFEDHIDMITKDIFFMAVKQNKYDVLKFCLENEPKKFNGVSFCEELNEYNNTALNQLFIEWCSVGVGQIEMMKLLIKHGSKIEGVKVQYKNILYNSVAEYIISKDNYEALQFLFEMGLNITENMLKSLIKLNGDENLIKYIFNSLLESSTSIEDINAFIILAIKANLNDIAQVFIRYALQNNEKDDLLKVYVQLSRNLYDEEDISDLVNKLEGQSSRIFGNDIVKLKIDENRSLSRVIRGAMDNCNGDDDFLDKIIKLLKHVTDIHIEKEHKRMSTYFAEIDMEIEENYKEIEERLMALDK